MVCIQVCKALGAWKIWEILAGDKIVHDCSTDGFGPFAGKIVCILDCSWQGRPVYGITWFSPDHVMTLTNMTTEAIISKSVSCKRHIRNSTGIFRVRLEFSTQIILPSTIFRTNFVESFALRLVRFESQKEKKPYTYQQGKGQWAFTVISGNRFSIITLMILQIPFSKPTCFELKILTAGRVPLKVQKKKKNLLNLEGGNRAEQIQSYFSN